MKKIGIIIGLLLWGIIMFAQTNHEDEVIYKADSASVLVTQSELLFTFPGDDLETGGEEKNLMELRYPPLENVKNGVKFYHFYNLPTYSSIGYFGNGKVITFQGKRYILTARHSLEPLYDSTGIVFGEGDADIAVEEIDTLIPAVPVSLLDSLRSDSLCSYSFFHTLGKTRWVYRTVKSRVVTLNEDTVRKSFFTEETIQEVLDKKLLPLTPEKMTGVYVIDGVEFRTDASTPEGVVAYIKKTVLEDQQEKFLESLKDWLTIEVDSAVYDHAQGSSGSAVYNSEGKIIAVVVAISTISGEHYVHLVPIQKILTKLVNNKVGTHRDYHIDKANAYNLLIAVEGIETTKDLTLNSCEKDTVIPNGDTLMITITTDYQRIICDKHNLPSIQRLSSYGNGVFMNLEGKTCVLTALHCVDEPEAIENAKFGKDSADIILIKTDTLLCQMPDLVPGEVDGLCTYTYFHELGTDEWHYREVTGDTIVVSRNDIFSSEDLDSLMVEVHKSLQIMEIPDTTTLLCIYGLLVSISSTDMEVMIMDIRKAINDHYDDICSIMSESIVMEVDSEVGIFSKGSSGSALFNSSGGIAGVVSMGLVVGGSRYYVLFTPISKILYQNNK